METISKRTRSKLSKTGDDDDDDHPLESKRSKLDDMNKYHVRNRKISVVLYLQNIFTLHRSFHVQVLCVYCRIMMKQIVATVTVKTMDQVFLN